MRFLGTSSFSSYSLTQLHELASSGVSNLSCTVTRLLPRFRESHAMIAHQSCPSGFPLSAFSLASCSHPRLSSQSLLASSLRRFLSWYHSLLFPSCSCIRPSSRSRRVAPQHGRIMLGVVFSALVYFRAVGFSLHVHAAPHVGLLLGVSHWLV